MRRSTRLLLLKQQAEEFVEESLKMLLKPKREDEIVERPQKFRKTSSKSNEKVEMPNNNTGTDTKQKPHKRNTLESQTKKVEELKHKILEYVKTLDEEDEIFPTALDLAAQLILRFENENIPRPRTLPCEGGLEFDWTRPEVGNKMYFSIAPEGIAVARDFEKNISLKDSAIDNIILFLQKSFTK